MNTSRLNSVLIALLIGACITFWGLMQMNLTMPPTFGLRKLLQYLGVLIIAIVIIESLAKITLINRLAAGTIIAFLIALLTGTIWPLFVILLFLFSSYILGLSILSVLKIDTNKESGLISFLIGVSIYGTVIGLMAHFPINYSGIYAIALFAPLIVGWRSLIRSFQSLNELKSQYKEFKLLDLAIVLIALTHFTVALMPEVGHDALAMHLFIPGHMAYRHEWGFNVNNYVFAVMPTLVDWIYSLVYMLAGETAVRLINVGFVFSLALLLRSLVLWSGGNKLGARWASLIFLATPLTFTESSSSFIESAWTAFIIAGALTIFKMLSSTTVSKTHMPIAAILLGSALAAKAVTLTIIPILVLLLIYHYKSWFKTSMAKTIFLSLLIFLAIGAIPYATAWYITGNPVFPFFNEIFQAPQYPAVNFSAPSIFEKGVSWDTIYRITFESGKYLESKPGAAGFQWLLLLIPSIILFISTVNRKGLILVFTGVLIVVLTFQQTAYLRYILPSYVILTAAIGLALSILLTDENSNQKRFVILICTITVCLNILFLKSGTSYGYISPKALLSDAGRTQYLQSRLPIRNAVHLINQLNIANAPVAVFAPPLMAGLTSDALYASWYNHKFKSSFDKTSNADEIAKLLLEHGVDFVLIDKNRVTTEKLKIIEDATSKILGYGDISVRLMRQKFQYNTELLKDTRFIETNIWSISKDAKRTTEGLIVKRKASATQMVSSVNYKQKYMLTIKASCLNSPTLGRLQINWLNSKSKFITANISTYKCTKTPKSNSMKMRPPKGADKAVVYATGHTNTPILIHEVSFKK